MIQIERKWVTGPIDEPTILNNYDPKPATVNWSAAGSVSIEEARKFAKQILILCDNLENNDEK